MKKIELPISIKIGDEEIELNAEQRLKCSKELINEQLAEQPAEFAWFAVIYELATEEADNTKMEFEVVEAALKEKIRNTEAEKGKKITDKRTEDLVKLEEEYMDAFRRKTAAKRVAGILKGLKEAFFKRYDSLISLASNYRAEMDTDVWMKKKQYEKEMKNHRHLGSDIVTKLE